MNLFNLNGFSNRRILVTGHTGFKGSWVALWLAELGAEVHGYALPPHTTPALYTEANVRSVLKSEWLGDVNDTGYLQHAIERIQPEYVFHLAAQTIVGTGYHAPLETWETNTLGTVRVLECCRKVGSVKSAVFVTTDKVYENHNCGRAFKESDALGGSDPYASSKSAAEHAVASWRKSFPQLCPVSTVRAGNVIGGGDWAENRIVPDCIRAFQKGELPEVRNPHHVRPWQYVLDPLYGYMQVALAQEQSPQLAGAWNFGPDDSCTVAALVLKAAECWGIQPTVETALGKLALAVQSFKEDATLALDSSKAHALLGWVPVLRGSEAIATTVDWYKRNHELRRERMAFQLCYAHIGEYMRRRA